MAGSKKRITRPALPGPASNLKKREKARPRTSAEIIAEADATLQHTLRLQQQFAWLQVEVERTRERLERTRRNIVQSQRELYPEKRKVLQADSPVSAAKK